MESLSKGEFLSFLYSEKSRELENNNAPGWSLWAIWGIIISLCLFIYDKIKHSELNLNIIVLYFVVALSWLLMLIHLPFYYKRPRIYSHTKLRRLKDEAPISLYVVRSVLSIVGLCISIFMQFEWYCYTLWGITCLINIYIIGYVYLYKDRIVKAGPKINVFSKDIYDLYVNLVLILLYVTIFLIQLAHIKDIDFLWDEFEIVISMLLIITCCCVWINLAQHNKIAEGIDYIIEAFTGGFIDQKNAYKQYTYLIYGMKVLQILEKEINQVLSIREKYEPIKKELSRIQAKIESKEIHIIDLKEIIGYLDKKLSYCSDLVKIFNKLIKRNRDILKLDVSLIVLKDLTSELTDLENSMELLNDVQLQISQVRDQVEIYIKTYLYCRKTDCLCERTDCKYRRDPISWKYKLKLAIHRIFHKQLLNDNN